MPQGKMRLVLLICFVSLLAIAGGIAWLAGPSRPAPESHNSYRVDERAPETKALMTQAINGSPESAIKLVGLYSHCHKSNPSEAVLERCKQSIKFWTQIAVENGSITAIKYYVDDLLGTGRCIDTDRAAYWYRRLQKLGERQDLYMKSLGEEIGLAKRSCHE